MKLSVFILFALILIVGCSSEQVAEDGDLISLHYTGKLEDGTVFDSSIGRDPLAVNLGAGEIIPGLEKELYGLKVGDTKTVTVSPEEGYGAKRPEMIGTVPREFIPQAESLAVGSTIQSQAPNGQIITATVIDITEDSVTIDANPPLAGKTMIFEIEVLEVSKATK